MPWWILLAAFGVVAVSKQVQAAHAVKVAGPWGPVIRAFGGRPLPVPTTATLQTLGEYLRQSGVWRWDAASLTRPNNASVAARYGYQAFVPPLEWFPRWVAMALVAQSLAAHAPSGQTPRVRNLYRPADYNADPQVGGESDSYHVTAQAVDVDFAHKADRQAAEAWLRRVYCKNPYLKMGLGVGRSTLHVDLLGDFRRPAQWPYDDTARAEGVTEGTLRCP